jgi:hypothetical protein
VHKYIALYEIECSEKRRYFVINTGLEIVHVTNPRGGAALTSRSDRGVQLRKIPLGTTFLGEKVPEVTHL